ncbi:hypothetical protein S3E15_03377 [Bacillus mycoides]|uniref:Uncharacterized protein n=1 Tax=Bacillus mycoides TaxID=1405 RepID=A0AAP7WB19_BACMY|nr:hypothetical protein SZ39_3963 [Bacillus mycoides]KZD35205.1 hypothetical protein B4083_3611 [Bacillus cereus]KUH45642.1 hypothetical protein M2E15_3426 [Bacillus mycoides]KZE07167.1 hypothetical protein B4117_1134 [Bacillus mycoides]OSX94779.1 hypothetical protein S3E15_03377 [Bacillus mycoides]
MIFVKRCEREIANEVTCFSWDFWHDGRLLIGGKDVEI